MSEMKKVDMYGEPIKENVVYRNINGNPHTPINPKTGEVLLDKQPNQSEKRKDLQGEAGDANSERNIVRLLGREYIGYKGQAAIDKLMREKQGHIKAAFHRDDIGDIDLLWGCDTFGLQHILQRREDQGINSAEFVKGLSDVIEKGTFVKRNDRGNFEFVYDSKVAIVSPELYGNKLTFLLTAFKTHSKNRHCN